MLIVAPGATAASLVARRLMTWGARTCLVPDEQVALALVPERAWSAVLVDHTLGDAACEQLAQATGGIPRRIVLITPAERPALAALKETGFTGYLVKPVRAASLAARMTADEDVFERAGGEPGEAEAAPARLARAHDALAILVAEDNEINALLALALLTRLGHRPTMAATGDAAVDAWTTTQAAGATLRPRAHGPAHARQRRHRGHAPHPRDRSRARRSRARRSSRSPPTRSTRTATPASPPAWMVS